MNSKRISQIRRKILQGKADRGEIKHAELALYDKLCFWIAEHKRLTRSLAQINEQLAGIRDEYTYLK